MRVSADFKDKPWRNVQLKEVAGVDAVPTMLAKQEQQLYVWLTSEWMQGRGEVVDIGCFVGGSTARLAAGHERGGHRGKVHAYDRFTAAPGVKRRQLYQKGIAKFYGPDIFPLAQRLLAPWSERIEFHQGNIEDLGWTGGPIEILTLDASKKTELTDQMTADFFPSLIPGHSVIIQQDFLHWSQPWIAAQMVSLSDHFQPVGFAPDDTVIFLCLKEITPEALKAARTTDLSDNDLLEAIARTRDMLAPFGATHRLDRMEQGVRDNPGVRVAWQMKRAEA